MSALITKDTDPASVPTPASGKTAWGTNLSSQLYLKDDTGAVTVIASGGTVTSVAVSSTDGSVSFTGSPITTSGTIDLEVNPAAIDLGDLAGDLDLATQVTGALPIANGGTGATTASTALNALLPTQAGNAGKVLSTDGTDASWEDAGSASPLTTKGDLYAFSTVDDRLPVGTNGQMLFADSAESTGLLWSSTRTSTTPLTLQDTGTPNASISLNVPGSTGGPANISVSGNGSTVAGGVNLIVTSASSTGAASPASTQRRSRGTVSSPTAINSGDQIGLFNFQGHDGTAFGGAGTFGATATENWTTGAHGSRLYFGATPDGSTTVSTVARMLHTGTVGILQFPASAGTVFRLNELATSALTFANDDGTDVYATINNGFSASSPTDLVRKSDLDAARAPKYEYITATAAQTSFFPSTTPVLPVDSGYAYTQIFRNGVKLIEGLGYTIDGDYEITLADPANAGDIIEFYTFGGVL